MSRAKEEKGNTARLRGQMVITFPMNLQKLTAWDFTFCMAVSNWASTHSSLFHFLLSFSLIIWLHFELKVLLSLAVHCIFSHSSLQSLLHQIKKGILSTDLFSQSFPNQHFSWYPIQMPTYCLQNTATNVFPVHSQKSLQISVCSEWGKRTKNKNRPKHEGSGWR